MFVKYLTLAVPLHVDAVEAALLAGRAGPAGPAQRDVVPGEGGAVRAAAAPQSAELHPAPRPEYAGHARGGAVGHGPPRPAVHYSQG